MPKRHHQHLTHSQRCQIYALKGGAESLSVIAKQVGVHKSTISRELHRNGKTSEYCHEYAQKLAETRRRMASRIPRKMTSELIAKIEEKLSQFQWSPEQIAGRLKHDHGLEITHESIYRYIWDNKLRGGSLYKNLRRRGKKYKWRGSKQAGRGLIRNRIGIEHRPEIAQKSIQLGHWEVDSIIGAAHKGVLVSLVEKMSKFTKILLVKNKTAKAVTTAIKATLKPIKECVLTMTSDNGKEFSGHEELAKELEADFFFADPYKSCQRGLNEHTNGLIRQYFPKSISFDKLKVEEVQAVEDLLNFRPRKVLEFRMPSEVFNQAKTELSTVAFRC